MTKRRRRKYLNWGQLDPPAAPAIPLSVTIAKLHRDRIPLSLKLEMLHIARAAETRGTAISPHNARGPVATAVALSVCAAVANVESLELQWGEADWRSTLIDPPEQIEGGMLAVHDEPGFGIELAPHR